MEFCLQSFSIWRFDSFVDGLYVIKHIQFLQVVDIYLYMYIMYIYIQKSLGCTSFGGLDNHVKAVPQEDVFLAALSPREMLLVSTGCKNLPGVCHTGGFLLSHASDLGESLISNKGNYSCSSINYDDLKGSPVVSWMQ